MCWQGCPVSPICEVTSGTRRALYFGGRVPVANPRFTPCQQYRVAHNMISYWIWSVLCRFPNARRPTAVTLSVLRRVNRWQQSISQSYLGYFHCSRWDGTCSALGRQRLNPNGNPSMTWHSSDRRRQQPYCTCSYLEEITGTKVTNERVKQRSVQTGYRIRSPIIP